MASARANAEILRQNGLLSDTSANEALSSLACSDNLDETVRQVDLVIESAPENLGFKHELFAHLDGISKPEAVLASNTSGLSITSVAAKCSRPERVLTTHFWNPPHLVPLVEIVKGEKTSETAVEVVRALLVTCGKRPVVVHKDRPGQLGNRLQMALVREAAHMIAEGIASAEDIDIAIRSGLGLRYPAYGLLEHQDLVGLDMVLSICAYVGRDLYHGDDAPLLLKKMVEDGHLGAKTGQGFLAWESGDADAVRSRRDRFLIDYLRAEKSRAEVAG
jgi:3-hydroxybutyryl-CoA dehydrogenase